MSELDPTTQPSPTVRRRGLLVGAGVAALAGAAAVVPARADAAPEGPVRTSAGGDVRTQSSTIVSTIAGPTVGGRIYRYASMFDFSHENGSTVRRWGGAGVYTDASSLLHASLEIPAGARVREVEWYVRNTTGSTQTGSVRIWRAGMGTLGSAAVTCDLPSTDDTAGIVAYRALAPDTNSGPYPLGCKVDLLINCPGIDLQVNGARVGFDLGGASIGMQPGPRRVYDSRTTSKFATGEVRTITLPADLVVPGTTAVNLNIHALSGTGDGAVRIWPVGASEPEASMMHYQQAAIATSISVPVSASRQIRVRATRSVHLVLDVIHTVS